MIENKKENGNGWVTAKKASIAFGAVLSGASVISLIVWIGGSQVFATREAVGSLEAELKDKYATKEVLNLTLKAYEQRLAGLEDQQKQMISKMDKIYALILSRRGVID